MRIIELDATSWKDVLDYYEALLEALGAPDWHGRNANALIDSMIWGGINAIEPPYTVRIKNLKGASKHILIEIGYLKEDPPKQREEFRSQKGRNIEVYLETELN